MSLIVPDESAFDSTCGPGSCQYQELMVGGLGRWIGFSYTVAIIQRECAKAVAPAGRDSDTIKCCFLSYCPRGPRYLGEPRGTLGIGFFYFPLLYIVGSY